MAAKQYHSQFGEDIFVNNYFTRDDGFYVDVGSYHPVQLSNTALLYERGWTGITIDPNPDAVPLFVEQRPRDTHLAVAVGSENGTTMLYGSNRASMHTTSESFIAARQDNTSVTFTERQMVPVQTLASIFKEHISPEQNIHLLNIDVEGSEMAVLQSNDWNVYKPKMVLVEDITFSCMDPSQSEVFRFMQALGYKLVSVYHVTLIFVR